MYKYDEKWEVRSESDLLNESDYLSDRWINLPTIGNLTFFAQLNLLLNLDCSTNQNWLWSSKSDQPIGQIGFSKFVSFIFFFQKIRKELSTNLENPMITVLP